MNFDFESAIIRAESLTAPDRELDVIVGLLMDIKTDEREDAWTLRKSFEISGMKALVLQAESHQNIWRTVLPRYTASIDAAALLFPSWAFPLLDWNGPHCRVRNSLGIDFKGYTGFGALPQLAMLSAGLKLQKGQLPK